VAKKNPKPRVHALVVCDQIIRDEQTKKLTLVGCFNRFLAQTYPSRLSRLAVYVGMSEGHGSYSTEVRMVSASDGTVLMRGEAEIEFLRHHKAAEINITAENVPVPAAGEYVVEFICDGKVLMTKCIAAERLNAPKSKRAPRATKRQAIRKSSKRINSTRRRGSTKKEAGK